MKKNIFGLFVVALSLSVAVFANVETTEIEEEKTPSVSVVNADVVAEEEEKEVDQFLAAIEEEKEEEKKEGKEVDPFLAATEEEEKKEGKEEVIGSSEIA